MREVDRVADRVPFGRVYANELVTLVHLIRAKDLQINALATLLANAGFGDHLHKWKRTTVEDWDLEVVEFHNRIVNAHADEGREQMLRGGDQNAFFHQTGGVADLGDVA